MGRVSLGRRKERNDTNMDNCKDWELQRLGAANRVDHSVLMILEGNIQ